MFNISKIGVFVLLISILIANGTSYALEIERNEIFTKNELLMIDENAKTLNYIKNNLKPAINLKGASDEEEKKMLSIIFQLGYRLALLPYAYQYYPLNLKIGQSTVKMAILNYLNITRDIMASLEADDRLLLLISETRNRIQSENSDTAKPNPETLKLLQNIYSRISTHIQNTYGVSYLNYYSFGVWNCDVITLSKDIVSYGNLSNKISKNEYEKNLISSKNTLKIYLNQAQTYKSSVKDLTNKAVPRNLDNLYILASEIKSDVETNSVQRAYDYSFNIYYAIAPTK